MYLETSWLNLGLVLVVIVLAALLIFLLVFYRRLNLRLDRQSHQIDLLSATVSASLDAVITANEKGEIQDYNAAAEQIFGWSKTEILGKTIEETIIPANLREAHAKGMKRYVKTKEPHVVDAGRIELSALRKTGEEFPIELNITCVPSSAGDTFIAYLRDISEQKISEQKLISARDQAKSTDRAKSRFLTLMSHEMRTPLNGILGVLDLLRTTQLNKRQERFVQVAAASGEILLEHINEALDITRIETGDLSLSLQVFSLKEQISRTVEVLRPLASEKGLTLELQIDPIMEIDFKGDANRITQILTNLIGNAIKFTNEGMILARVTGIHGPVSTEVEISVLDTGPGIPEGKMEDIFEEYVVLARSEGNRQSRGDGLGLAISRKVARLMNGDLEVSSEIGNGSTFTLTLPLQRATDSKSDRPKEQPLVSGDKKNVLIVEDNVINRSVLSEMLQGLGHETTGVENGLEGLKAADVTKFDLIIMDISMPFMDGIETTRRIREVEGPNKATYILGLTAHGSAEYRTKAQSAGMDGFATKPLRLSDLKRNLSKVSTDETVQPLAMGPVSDEIFRELRNALGDEKLKDTSHQFFEELETGLAGLKDQDPSSESAAISETLHKLRGAAALLGFNDIIECLDKTSSASKESDEQVYQKTISQTANAVAPAKAALNRMFESEIG